MKLKLILKFFLFISVYMLLNDRVTEIISPKGFYDIPNLNSMVDANWLSTMRGGFYSEKSNNIDVVFIGSSQIFCDINPNVIWNEYGITSYDFSAHRQEPGTSYYYLKQVFETQSPKVVVIEFYLNGDTKLDEYDQMASHYNFDFMKKDFYRLEAIWNRTEKYRMETFFPVMLYNQRWKELTMNDLFFKPYQHDFLKGSFLYMPNNQWAGSFRKMPENLPEYTLPEKTIHWLRSIQELCEQHDCECLFIKTPVTIYGYDQFSRMNDTEYYAYIRALEKYCKENDMSFLNLIGMEDEIGLDWDEDFVDSIHLNWNGQQIFSSYIGEYLRNTYQLESKKGLPGYEQWDEDYEQLRYYTDNFWDLYPEEL